jgi:2,3-bisphosphoglycerate-independent phosphoglycerate mutase
MNKPPVLLVFIDGIGIPTNASVPTPVRADICPRLMQHLADDTTPIDATLGVPGIPQSATGQTTILTGVNAPAKAGRHIEGFPGPLLRDIITEHNIYKQLAAQGRNSTFANGYLSTSVDQVHAMRMKSVTTVAALSAFGDVRRLDCLLRGEAVAHDLTRESLGVRGYTGPVITPEQAAADLAHLAATQAFTLFEFFQTDRAGHRMDMKQAEAVLQKLDRFIAALYPLITKAGILLILTSDHGNIEDLSTRGHTANPVPFMAIGPHAEAIRKRVSTLCDITPAIVDIATGKE